ncbi:MAG: D-tyrosyl-tRNA(Tyr) deacylase [Clostridiales bacterium]|nr:D-tyrosyl-tRNA(Tyr) deacylase [Clostridiales bacterium]
MRAVVQRVSCAHVDAEGRTTGRIGPGLLVLLGVERGDSDADLEYIVGKVAELRVFSDGQGKMNLSVTQAGGAILLISQFTLAGDARKGRRPDFGAAAPPEEARSLYELTATRLRERGIPVETGCFGAMMAVYMAGDGPVTILLDSRKNF